MFKQTHKVLVYEVKNIGRIDVDVIGGEVNEAVFSVSNPKGKTDKELRAIVQQFCNQELKSEGITLRASDFRMEFV